MYGENSIFTCTRVATDQEWRQERNKSIGGSDVAAILGISKWKSPTSVYIDKTQPTPDEDKKSSIMEFGNMMEPIIADHFKKEHPNILVRRANAILRPINRPWVHASLDYECRESDGTWGVLEIKVAASEAEWKDGVPPYYYVQGQHYLAVTGRSYVWFSVLFRDSCEMRDIRLERDQNMIDHINETVDIFWENVLSHKPPTTMSGTDDESGALAKLYADPNDKIVVVNDPKIENAAIAYETVSAQIKTLEKTRRQLADTICAKIGDAHGIALPTAKRRITWVRSQRVSYNMKALAKDHPDILEDYKTTSTVSGGLRIKKTR